MSRTWMVVAAALLVATCLGQTKWKHVKLLSEAPAPPVSGLDKGAFINAQGVAAYSSGGSAYKGTERYNDATQDGWVGGLNDAGQMAWRSNGHVFVDRQDISAGIVKDNDYHQVYIEGMSWTGRPFWTIQWGAPSTNGFEMYVGTDSLNLDTLLGANRSYNIGSGHARINRSGVSIFSGWGDANGGTPKVYEGGVDITTPILGLDGTGDYAQAINDSGQVAWIGRPSWSSNSYHAYVDGRDVTHAVLGDQGTIGNARDINNRGQLLWEGTTPSFQGHAFVDSLDLTAEVFGTARASATTYRISDSGHALWSGGLDGDFADIFVDDRNLSKDLLGGHRHAIAWGLDGAGHALWDGVGDDFTARQVFVDQFNLGADALGTTSTNCYALAIGPAGHILWRSLDLSTGLDDFWLSTPVPEPSAVALGFLAATSILMRQRKRRASAS